MVNVFWLLNVCHWSYDLNTRPKILVFRWFLQPLSWCDHSNTRRNGPFSRYFLKFGPKMYKYAVQQSSLHYVVFVSFCSFFVQCSMFRHIMAFSLWRHSFQKNFHWRLCGWNYYFHRSLLTDLHYWQKRMKRVSEYSLWYFISSGLFCKHYDVTKRESLCTLEYTPLYKNAQKESKTT